MTEDNNTVEPPAKQGLSPADQGVPAGQAALASADAGKPGTSPSGSEPGTVQRRSSSDQNSTTPPWRVEGAPPAKDDDKDKQRRGWSRFWWTVTALLLLNFLLSFLLVGPQSRTTVPYSYFLTQLNARNVQSITATGNTIEGTFKHEVSYPPRSAQAQQVQQFTTERPTFATDPLFRALQNRRGHSERRAAEPEHSALGGPPALVRPCLVVGRFVRRGSGVAAGWAGSAPWAASASPAPSATTRRPPTGPRSPTSPGSTRSRTR